MDTVAILGAIGLCILAYLLGSIPFGKIIGHFRKIDVQNIGSHNIGATNVLRASGKLDAALTFGLDAAKAGLPVYLASKVFYYPWQVVAPVAFFAILGSCFSIWLKLKTGSWTAGKGISALLGVLAARIGFPAFLVVFLIWAIPVFFFIANRKMSQASFFLVASIPVLYLVLPYPVLVIFWPFAIVPIGWRHRENVIRILKGEEEPVSLNLPKRLQSFLEEHSLEALLVKFFPPKNKKRSPK